MLLNSLDIDILGIIRQLPSDGVLTCNHNGLVYLDVTDDYIHRLFPLICDPHVYKPDYFNEEDPIGAHISVIYPEEISSEFAIAELGQRYEFSADRLFCAELNAKNYYVLRIISEPLLKLRQQYGLPEKLHYQGYQLDLHITVGVAAAAESLS